MKWFNPVRPSAEAEGPDADAGPVPGGPRHVAIIMDGNGRWAKKHALQVAMGHRRGTEALREIIRQSSDMGIASLSLYAFSTENWGRPPSEG